jgi:hypothetical protein
VTIPTTAKKIKNKKQSPGAVAQACNPSYSGGGDREDHVWFEASSSKKFVRSHLDQWLDHDFHFSYTRKHQQEVQITVQADLGIR